jgi:hypothetical protein
VQKGSNRRYGMKRTISMFVMRPSKTSLTVVTIETKIEPHYNKFSCISVLFSVATHGYSVISLNIPLYRFSVSFLYKLVTSSSS